MKKANIVLLSASFAFVLLGCSSPAYVEKDNNADLSAYNTYMWVETRESENDNSQRSTAFADISVHNSVGVELNKWGWREVSENPDVLLSYDVLVERTVSTQSDPVYSQPFSRLYYNPYTRRWSTIYYSSQFLGYQQYRVPVREATITISMVDANTDKKIWQGWTSETLNSGLTDLNIKKSVRNIFKESGNTAP